VSIASFLAKVVAGLKIAADLRPAVVNLAAIHRAQETALLLERERKELVRPAGSVVTARQSQRFGVDARFPADVLDRDENGKGSATGATFVALIAKCDVGLVNRVRH
jgi:hypothetical protein